MAPSDMDTNNQELNFITEIKNEFSAPPRDSLQPDLSVYLGMRRNSSFADYFEGDLSQNLLSRRHFSESSSTKSGLISTLVNKIRADGQNISSVEPGGTIDKNSKVIPSFSSFWLLIF